MTTLLLLGLLLLLSGLVSGSETALFSLRLADRRRLAERHPVAARLLGDPGRLLVTLLVANLLVNVAYFSVSASLSLSLAADGRRGLSAVVAAGSLAAIVVAGEILPKTLALVAPRRLVERLLPVLAGLRLVLGPLVVLGSAATRLLEGLLLGTGAPATPGARDFKSALSGGTAVGSFHAAELALLHDVVDFGERRARNLMVPRVDVAFLDLQDDHESWLATLRARPHSDYPVVDGSPDALRGTINAARLLFGPQTPREALLEPPLLAPLTMRAERLVQRLRDEDRRLAILLDEFGGVAGVVGLGELSRSVLGEVEPALEPGAVLERGAGSWLVRGDCPLHDLEEELQVALPSRRASTLAGLLGESLARVPRRGDEMLLRAHRVRVVATRGGRVEWVLVRRASGAGPPPTKGAP